MSLIYFVHRSVSFLSKHIKAVVLVYFLLQIVYAFYFPQSYTSDAQYYYRLAQECINSNEFYPAHHHIFEDYIVAPLYINILILLLKIANSTLTITLFNLIINILQLWFISKITERYFNKITQVYAILCYIFYFNTFGLVFLNYTELFFTFLIVSSIYFYSCNKKNFYVLSGIFIAASIGVRPVGWSLLAAMLIIDGLFFIQQNKIKQRFFLVLIGFVTFIFSFGAFNYSNFNKFIFTSTTGPVNLLLGANESATGGFDSEVFEYGNRGYIADPDSLTYKEIGDFYYDKALEWIEENPVKWISLMPLKLIHTFSTDDIAISTLLKAEDWNLLRTLKFLLIEKDLISILNGRSLTLKIFYFIVQISAHIFYFFLVIILFAGLFKYRKELKINHNFLLHLFFVLIGLLMIMVTVGTPRYKYPFIIVMIPFIANYLYRFTNRDSVKIKNA